MDWSYFAAIIDGEGHLGDPGNGLIINTTNYDLAVRLRRDIGGSLRKIEKRKHKTVYNWKMKGWKLIEFADKFENYLVLKKNEIELWKEWYNTPRVYNNQFVKNYNPRQKIFDKLRTKSNYPLNSVELPHRNNTEPSSITSKTNSYLAGIIDGEGYIIMRHRTGRWGTTYLPQTGVCNTDIRLMYWLVKYYGGHVSVMKGNRKWRDRFYWNADVNISRNLIKKIEQYAIIKKPHLKQLKKFYNLQKELKERHWVLTQHSRKRANKIAKTISILNHKHSLLVKGEGVETFKGDAK